MGAGAEASAGARLCWYRSPVDCVMGSKPTFRDLSCSRFSASGPDEELRRWSFSGRSPVLQAFSECCELSRSTFLCRSSFPDELILWSLLGRRPPVPPWGPLSSSVLIQSTENTLSRRAPWHSGNAGVGVDRGEGSEFFSACSLTLYGGVGTSKVLWNWE